MTQSSTARPSRGRWLIFGLAAFALTLTLAGSALAQGVQPRTVELDLDPGESATVTKTVQTPANGQRQKLDVYFLADTTGSMGTAIADVRNNSNAILNAIDAASDDSQYGVGDYKDVGDPYVFKNCTGITPDRDLVRNTCITGWSASGGGDEPEGQLFALQRVATGAGGFRPNSARVIVWFGDAPGHDPRNGATEASATAALQAAGIKVFAISVGANRLNLTGQASRIAAATNGLFRSGVNPAELADVIIAGLQDLPFNVRPEAQCPAGISVAFTPTEKTVAPGQTAEFTETVSVAPGAPGGTHVCTVRFLIDGAPGGDEFTQTLTINVNRPPVANDDAASTPKNTPVTVDVLANDSDPDGDALTVSSVQGTSAEGGSVVDNGDGTVTYTPPTGFVGTDTFRYKANDGTVDSNAATVTVDVINRPPDAVNDAAETFKHTSIGIPVLANDSDPDGDPLTISAFDAASTLGGTVADNGDGTLTYTSPNQSGLDTFTYTITDGLDTDTATVRIRIVNRVPDCSRARPSISTIWPPNHKFVDVDAERISDPDGDPLTITVVSIRQDEPTDTNGDGRFAPDGKGVGTATAHVRAERSGTKKVPGDGRVYHITFQADDGDGGACTAEVLVGVPHDQRGDDPVDGGALHDSTEE